VQIRVKRSIGAWLVSAALAGAALYPVATSQWAVRQKVTELDRVRDGLTPRRAEDALGRELSLRVQRLSGLLASWETIGGCGAGSSTGSGGGVKWIGRSTTGGLFQLQSQASYTHLEDGYHITINTQLSRDLADRVWAVGVSVPLLYKYYRNYYDLQPPVDVSNGGVGDVGVFVTRRFGEINATALTLLVGLPTGTHDAKYRNDYLTQEKQLGLGKFTGSLTLDHTMDQEWGLAVLGGSFAYRGGENARGNYRSPAASVYGYVGYFAGPWVPSLGLTVQRFFGVDRDRGLKQEQRLMSVAGSLAIEWSSDTLALLAGVSLPFGFDAAGAPPGGTEKPLGAGFEPWTASIGLSVSPF
jgi:hypothetical protein